MDKCFVDKLCEGSLHTWIYDGMIRKCKSCVKKEVLNFETNEWEALIPENVKDLISDSTPLPYNHGYSEPYPISWFRESIDRVTMDVKIVGRQSGFKASLVKSSIICGHGESIESAIGNMILANEVAFGLIIHKDRSAWTKGKK